MSKYLLSVKETYRADSETEATTLINDAKTETSAFTLDKYDCTYKERKAKGEVVDSYYKVTLVKTFDDEKNPCRNTLVKYDSENIWDEPEEKVIHGTI